MRKMRWLTIVPLLAGAAGLGLKLRGDWRAFGASNDPAAIKLRSMSTAPVPDLPAAHDYTVVAQQNPFHPDRNDTLPPPPPQPGQAAVGPPPLVYGSMILGQDKFALMASDTDPKPRKIVEGEVFDGYKLAEVKAQSVVLEAGGTKSEVMFYNALSRLRRDAQKTAPRAATAPASARVDAPAPAAAEAPTPPPGKKVIQTLFGPMVVDK